MILADFVELVFLSVTLQLVVSVLFDSQQIGNTTMHFYSTSHPFLSKNHWFSFLRGTTLLPIIMLPGMKVTFPIWGGQGIHFPFTDNILESQLCPTDFPKLQNMWVPLKYDRNPSFCLYLKSLHRMLPLLCLGQFPYLLLSFYMLRHCKVDRIATIKIILVEKTVRGTEWVWI